jgi:hypothetical protein
MPDERLDSMRQGIAPAPESAEARHADELRRAENRQHPIEMESAMGGSSDSERAGDDASFDAEQHVGLRDDRTASAGGESDDG